MAIKELIKNKKYQIIVSYRNEDSEPRNKKSVFYGTYKDALLEEQLMMEEVINGIVNKITFKSLFDECCDLKRGEVAESTLIKDIEVFDKYLTSIENKEADSLRYRDILILRKKIDAIGGSHGQKNKAIYLFKRISKYGHRVYDYPYQGDDITLFKKPLKKNKISPTWTPEEFEYVLKFEPQKVYKMLFELYFWTGMRRGCALALFKKDLLDTKEVDVYNSINSNNELGSLKNASSYRRILLHDDLYNRLLPYKDNPGEYLLGDHKNLAPNTVNRRFKEAQERAAKQRKKDNLEELPYLTIHQLRHSHATFLASIGVPIAAISARLGHSTVFETMNTYTHLFRGDDKKVIENIDDYLNSNTQKKSD